MRTKTISELFSVATIGSLFGLSLNASHLKWHNLGREAFLAHESQYFDKTYLNPAPAVRITFVWFLTALFIYAIHRCIVFGADWILRAISLKNAVKQE